MSAEVYLIPTVLEEEAIETIPAYLLDAVKNCQVIFAEQERTTRRFLKKMDKSIVIDDFEWFAIHKAEDTVQNQFRQKIKEGKKIAIISEAGCPGVADPGQLLVAVAQQMGTPVKPLVGPSSILLALMASGMNGQLFSFWGYLPIDNMERQKQIRELEALSAKQGGTHIFIETPYRNDQMLEQLMKICKPATRICVAYNLTAKNEWVQTKTAAQWKQNIPALHKVPCIFLLQA